MLFKQLFHRDTASYTYLIACPDSRQAVLIDPVASELSQYLALLSAEQLTLRYALDTHIHADHITASGQLRQQLHCAIATGTVTNNPCMDLTLEDQQQLSFADNETLQVIATPGHTEESVCFLWRDRLFTGDTLLINGCGRTDFQGGSASSQYQSIQRLFQLDDEILVYPGHDYHQLRVSCIGQEKYNNPRLANKTEAEFTTLMAQLNLPYPKAIDIAVPANQLAGCQATDNASISLSSPPA
ncbi:MAG TPA: Zn-dependent hydrolase [Gammaproteobacteria bacterium]|nr:Zn-dependent hydrolase [Gammaproteobacteria bacterium]HAU06595.1 Zn-dependent hydrolase [Gammaproteobacteria bacterium]